MMLKSGIMAIAMSFPAGAAPIAPIVIELPPELEAQRADYDRLINDARAAVLAWFNKAELPLQPSDLIDRAIVYADTDAARRALAPIFQIAPDRIPSTFGGTVNGKTLYLVSEAGFRPSWIKLYPQWPWSRASYRSLIVHELAHRAHAYHSAARTGSEDAMGPAWFFEGLAVMCAGQFAAGERPLVASDILSQVGNGRTPKTSYPVFGRLVRSLARFATIRELVEAVDQPDFPERLIADNKTKRKG